MCAYYTAQTAQSKYRAVVDTETTARIAGNLNNPSPHNAPGQKEQNRTKRSCVLNTVSRKQPPGSFIWDTF